MGQNSFLFILCSWSRIDGKTGCAYGNSQQLKRRLISDPEPEPDPERAAVGVHHHLRDAVGVPGDDGGRPDDGARHHHDLHLLRLLRHVQRTQLQARTDILDILYNKG